MDMSTQTILPCLIDNKNVRSQISDQHIGGTEPPPGATKPGKSEYKRDPLTSLGLINAIIFDKTES